jgi:hypothetical protein
MQNKTKLVFVYNADSGISNMIKDCLHKLLSPKTYPCKLCDLTYGAFSERRKWKRYRNASNVDMQFLHADEFYDQYRSKFLPKFEFPVVLIQNALDLEIFVDKSTMDDCQNLDDFIQLIDSRLNYYAKA